jgi:hypothetical protein
MARIVQQRLGIAQIDDIQHQGPIYGQLSQTYERGGPKLTTAAGLRHLRRVVDEMDP